MGALRCRTIWLGALLLSMPALGHSSLGERLRQLNTRADEFVLGLLDDAVVLIAQRQTHLTFLVLRSDTLWTPQLLNALLDDRSFLPRCALGRWPPTVVGTLLTHTGSADLALRWWDGSRWSQPEALSALNSSSWDGQPTLSPDAQWLVFASDRPGGAGGLDLYYSRRLPDGSWEPPQNLGPPVNTSADDAMPWFLPDGRLLYASRSSGRWQLYAALPVAPGQWRQAIALPPPIASEYDELTPVLWHDTLLLASNRSGGRGGYDLYAFPLCGPVTVVVQPPQLAESIRGRLTLQVRDSTFHTPASTPLHLRTAAFQTIRIRYDIPCRPTVELTVTAPCDLFRSVLYWVALPADSLPDLLIEVQFPEASSYQLLTAEHAWSRLFQARCALHPTPTPDTTPAEWWTADVHATEQILDSLVRILSTTFAPQCQPPKAMRAHITATADPTLSVLYTGPPLSLAELQLWPATQLNADTLALLRAHVVAAELRRRLPPSTALSWELSAQLQPGYPRATVRLHRAPE